MLQLMRKMQLWPVAHTLVGLAGTSQED